MKYIRVQLTNLVRIKKIVTCFTDEREMGFVSGTESHNFWEMVYVRRGALVYVADGKSERMTAGEVIFHSPNVIHTHKGDGKTPPSFFIVTFVCESPAMEAIADRRIRVPDELIPLIDNTIKERGACFTPRMYPLTVRDDAQIGSQQMIGSYLEQFIIGILREEAKSKQASFYTSHKEFEAQLAEDVRTYLEEHLYDNVDLATLCEHFHYGKSRLSAIFRRVHGDSIMHWYLCRKMEAAKQEIMAGEGSIADIAARLQFESPQYFSRMFRRYTGMCPRDFRAEMSSTAVSNINKEYDSIVHYSKESAPK
ncbi:MAG: helix-turn-helix transcriptional regulator [Clostridia bacterium]|nr:helix-turn-helix transcriptional regulator [Clostridia bacterium]